MQRENKKSLFHKICARQLKMEIKNEQVKWQFEEYHACLFLNNLNLFNSSIDKQTKN